MMIPAITKFLLLINLFLPGAIPQGFSYSGSASGGGGAKTLIGSASGTNAGGFPVATYSPTAGNAVLAWIATSSTGTVDTWSVVDNASGGSSTYTSVFSGFCPGGVSSCALYVTCNVKSGATSVSAGLQTGTGNDTALIVMEIHGNLTSGCVDKQDSTGATANSAGPATGNAMGVTSTANEMIVGLFNNSSGATFSTSGSYTLLTNQAHDGGGNSGITYQIVSSTSTYTPAAALSGSGVWTAQGVTIQ